MKASSTFLAVSAATSILAGPASSQQAEPSRFHGSWAVDVSALPTPPEERPRSVTFTFADAGNNRWNTRLVVVAADGTTRSSEVTHTLDGTATQISGNVGPDTVAVTTPSPDVMVMALSGQGVPYLMRVFTLGPDGNSQTETAVYFQPDGTPVIRETQLTRVQ